MDQILLASGLYGLSGSVLLVIFHLIPGWKEKFDPRNKPFFHGKTQEDVSLAEKYYSFYSQLWSFRLIGTSFLIIILYSVFPSGLAHSPYNLLFVAIDIPMLSYFAGWGIDGISKNTLDLHSKYSLVFYIPLSVMLYSVLLIYFRIFNPIFPAAAIIAQILFSFIWYLKNKDQF